MQETIKVYKGLAFAQFYLEWSVYGCLCCLQ